MKKPFFNLLLVLLIAANSCNNTTPISDDEYFKQQALKNNYSDKLLFGLSFAMDRNQMLAQIEKEGAVKLYSTPYWKGRLGMIERLVDEYKMPYDFGVNDAFMTSIVLKTKEAEFLEKVAIIMFDFEKRKPTEIKVCINGSPYEDMYNGETFNAIKTTLIEKYGNPYKETNGKILWVKGIIHISLAFEGKKAMDLSLLDNTLNYVPLYVITYSNWPFIKEIKEHAAMKRQEWQKQQMEYERIEQERLGKEYRGL